MKDKEILRNCSRLKEIGLDNKIHVILGWIWRVFFVVLEFCKLFFFINK